MIPALVESHLRETYRGFEHHTHVAAATAQELAAADHVTGYRVAKPVVVKLDGALAIAVVAATDRVNLGALEEATASRAELVSESEFSGRFSPCDAGAEPPLAIFGAQIFVDDKLAREPRILMPAGTHEDSVVVETGEWMRGEMVQEVPNLGRRASAPAA